MIDPNRAGWAIIANCLRCGCPIYTQKNDQRGLPEPEYVCNCRFFTTAIIGATWPAPNYVPPSRPTTIPGPYTTWRDPFEGTSAEPMPLKPQSWCEAWVT